MRHKTYGSVVLYTRNEEATIGPFLTELAMFVEQHFEIAEIIVLDDSSTDDTLARAREAALASGASVTVVEMARRHGVEAAMHAGLERAVGDWIFELESSAVDFDLELLSRMYEIAATGHDVVTAAGDRGSLRSRLFYRVVNRYADLDEPLRTVRVRLVSRRSLNAMLAMKEKVRYRKALYAFVGARQQHLTYTRTAPAKRGTASHRLDRETSSLAFDVLLSFSGFGLRLAHRLSFTFGVISLLAIAYALFVYLTVDDVVEGWTTAVVLGSGGLAGLFLVLGILGEYLARILIEVRGRPLYSVRQTDVVVPSRSADHKPDPHFLAGQRDQASALHAELLQARPGEAAGSGPGS